MECDYWWDTVDGGGDRDDDIGVDEWLNMTVDAMHDGESTCMEE